jgi:hypothetical protein
MAIEITFLSVVLRQSALDHLPPGIQDLARGLFLWEPDWFREDRHLLATSFMCPADVRRFGAALERWAALFRGADWAVVDMTLGPLAPVPWLAFQGGWQSLAWACLQGEDPGELVRAPSLLPRWWGASPDPGRVIKLFGLDSNHDPEPHRGDFGRLLPDWGGKDLWLVEVGEGIDQDGRPRPAGSVSIEAEPMVFERIRSREGCRA